MTRHILIINGHPDPSATHFCHRLADAYCAGAQSAGHELRRIEVAALDFPWLRSQREYEHGAPPPAITDAQAALRWADHLVIVHPLWAGMVPALLKAFLEQALRPEFVQPRGALRGTSARIVITMGMPAFVYRWWFGAHGLKALRRSVLGLCGIGPIADTLIGRIEAPNPAARERALRLLHALGRAGR